MNLFLKLRNWEWCAGNFEEAGRFFEPSEGESERRAAGTTNASRAALSANWTCAPSRSSLWPTLCSSRLPTSAYAMWVVARGRQSGRKRLSDGSELRWQATLPASSARWSKKLGGWGSASALCCDLTPRELRVRIDNNANRNIYSN